MSYAKAIRHFIADGLRAAGVAGDIPLVGSRVYAQRTRPIPMADLPAIRVYTDRESVDVERGPTRYTRKLDVVLEVVSRAFETGPNELDEPDDIAHAVETWCMDREEPEDPDTAVYQWLTLDRVERGVEDAAQTPLGVTRVVFVAEYEDRAPRTAPTTTDFDLLGVEWTVPPHAAGTVDAEDLVTIPQD